MCSAAVLAIVVARLLWHIEGSWCWCRDGLSGCQSSPFLMAALAAGESPGAVNGSLSKQCPYFHTGSECQKDIFCLFPLTFFHSEQHFDLCVMWCLKQLSSCRHLWPLLNQVLSSPHPDCLQLIFLEITRVSVSLLYCCVRMTLPGSSMPACNLSI